MKNLLMKRFTFVFLAIFMTGCASMTEHRASQVDPDKRLDQLLALYQEINTQGDSCHEIQRAYSSIEDCMRIQREVERLLVEFPTHERIMMTNAVMQTRAGRTERAQYLLDQLLARPGAHPEAAILRSQLAMNDGNTARAKALLKQQILLRPDYAELRETLAAAYYLEGKYDDARRTLSIAGRLGASGWRVAYHSGLLREAQKDWAGACQAYLSAVTQKPDFQQAVARLAGLNEYTACQTMVN